MRAKSIKSLYEKKFKTYPFTGIWQRAIGEPETSGAWIIWGPEKNGKTWFALMLAKYLSSFEQVLYVSGEEGLNKDFRASCQRAGIDHTDKIKLFEYVPLLELEEVLAKRKAPRIVLIDNLTIYNDEFKYGKFKNLLRDHDDKLFIFLAHEENKQPYTSTAKMCKKLARIIIHIQGLAAHVSGRCPGGVITIDENKSQLCWGTEITNKSE